jgi:anhydro-N-acetylmuramic acid kinase
MENSRYIYGLMSGTSLDGVDVAICSFENSGGCWNYQLHYCTTIPYDEVWSGKLSEAHRIGGLELVALDREYGNYLGTLVNHVVKETGIKPFLIASHGHTIFHSPQQHVTLQIGCGAEIAAKTRSKVVCDFRSTDIALGGQGAPLVPIGDKLLFREYDACLNFGGFANISFDKQGHRRAFDICPVNFILNAFAKQKGQKYDRDGILGRSGAVNKELLELLNAVPFYIQSFPKSLAREWIETDINPILERSDCSFEDIVRTCYEHIAWQMARVLNENRIKNVLLTGGGTHNSFLLELLRRETTCKLVVAEPEIIDFKEALIFAFLGFLRYRGEVNCLASVTGASIDSVSGAIYSG